MQKRIGIFGGTFNPVHFGHINLAIEIKEKKQLSEIWVIPSHISPLRVHETQTSPYHRLQMAKLAFEEIPDFKVLDYEIQKPPPSYSVDTIKEFYKTYPHMAFFLILGKDSLTHFFEWKGAEELAKIIPFFVGSRSAEYSLDTFPLEIQKKITDGIVVTRKLDISATEVRKRLKNGQYSGHLVPAKVLDYICENQLYFEA